MISKLLSRPTLWLLLFVAAPVLADVAPGDPIGVFDIARFQQPPVILPANPGMQFTPPPSFSSTTGSQGGIGSAKPGDVDCQVR